MIWFAIPAALATGYLLGHYRVPQRAFDRLIDLADSDSEPRTIRRYALETLAAAMLLAALVVHPRQTGRRLKAARKPEKREPAPEFNSDWSSR